MKMYILMGVLYYIMCHNEIMGINPIIPSLCGLIILNDKKRYLLIPLFGGIVLNYVPPFTVSGITGVIKYLFVVLGILIANNIFSKKFVDFEDSIWFPVMCGAVTSLIAISLHPTSVTAVLMSLIEGGLSFALIGILNKGVQIIGSGKPLQPVNITQLVSLVITGCFIINGLYECIPGLPGLRSMWILGLAFSGLVLVFLVDWKANNKKLFLHEDVKEVVAGRLSMLAEAFYNVSGDINHIDFMDNSMYRNAMSGQMKEMSGFLKDISKDITSYRKIRLEKEKQVQESLALMGILVNNVAVIANESGVIKIKLEAKAARGTYVTLKDVAKCIGKVLKVKLAAYSDGYFVPKHYTVLEFLPDCVYDAEYGVATACKTDSAESGDNYSATALPLGQYLAAITDGMGSGSRAGMESRVVIEIMEELLGAGISEDRVFNYINLTMLLSKGDESFSTADVNIINLNSGKAVSYKCGGVTTYVKRKDKVDRVDNDAPPVGIIENMNPGRCEYKVGDGDMIIMVSDGVVDSIYDEDPENALKCYLENDDTDDPNELAEHIISLAKSCTGGEAIDDMTVLVVSIFEKR